MHRTTLFVFAATVAFTAALLAGAPAADAQVDMDRWTAPVAARTVLSLPGKGTVEGDTLYLPTGERLELEVHATDQLGRPFPQDRFRFEFDFRRDCGGLVELVDASDDGVTLETERGAGTCDVTLWVPGNMNLDRQLHVVVGRSARSGGSGTAGDGPLVIDTRQELIAASIFRALLDREPDRAWLDSAAAQVAQGDTRASVRSILASTEFQQRRATVPPEELLGDLYRGLLGREPDAGGVRTYLDEVQAGRFEEVVDILLRSSEFQQRLARELAVG
jgi:hypothetical protein